MYHCTMRGNLKKQFEYSTSSAYGRRVLRARHSHTTDSIAVGDRVKISETHRGAGIIEEILPRTSRFIRSGFRGQEQTLVCNLDQIVIVFACSEPRVDPWKLDRFLVASESEGFDPLIIANKADLVPPEERVEAFEEWEKLGYQVIPASTKTHVGIEEIRIALKDKISGFVGPSGVGKSSLLNCVQPGLNLKTADIGYVTFKGRHTTTAAQLIPLRTGGWVADTPGLRQMDLIQLDHDELVECFPEFRSLVGHCRFDNCRHDTEPDCAIKCAVDSEKVSLRRYESFLTLSSEMGSAKR